MSRIKTRVLSSGYVRVEVEGERGWAQVPRWPCSRQVFQEGTYPGSTYGFRRAVMLEMDWECDGSLPTKQRARAEEGT